MPFPFSCRALSALLFAAAASGCGGDPSIGALALPPSLPPAAPAPPPSTPAALAVSTDTLALAVSGQARRFVVTNVGGQDALNLTTTTTAFPTGTHFTTDCSALAPGASCTLTITPGATPSAAPGDTGAVPTGVSLTGSNTNSLALAVWVLGFGSVYQGGLVFDMDDAPTAGGVGGKVLALRDVSEHALRGSSDFVSITPDATSTLDGAANTAAIASQLGPPITGYLSSPAWECHVSEEAGFTDWYLPAICELGYDANHVGSGCGTSQAPALPNVRSNLVDQGHLDGRGYKWSSTQYAPSGTWQQFLGLGSSDAQIRQAVFVTGYARCARAITP